MGVVTSLVARPSQQMATTAPKTSPRNGGDATALVVYGTNGRARLGNAALYRHWAKSSEWVKGAITIRRSQVSSAEWDIVPYDQKKPWSKRLALQIKELFTNPNPRNDSFRAFIEMIIDDIITLDAGSIEKVRNLRGDLVELWPVDGAEIRVSATWDGNPREPRYFWYPKGTSEERASFLNDDFVYMMAHPRTDSPIGMPPLETLRLAIESELVASEYNRRQVSGAAPDGVMDLGEGMSREQVISFRSFFENEVAGRGALGFIGGTKGAQFIRLHENNRNMQFLEWQIYLVRKIAVVLGLTPQDLGVTFDINRSTSEIQAQISEDRGLRPLMSTVQEYMTQEIVWDRGFGGSLNNLAFRFTALNLKESTAKADILEKALGRVPWREINEARIEEGREPFKGLDGKLIMATPQGALDLSDVPTVREYFEMQFGNRNQPEQPPAQKQFLEALQEVMGRLSPPDQRPIEVFVESQKPQQVDVQVANPPSIINISQPTRVTRDVEFITDERGRIIGKHEVETHDVDQPE